MPPSKTKILEARLAEIDKRRAAIEAELTAKPGDTYRNQELGHEQRALDNLRAETARELNPPKPENIAARLARRAQILDLMEKEQREQTQQFVATLEKMGAHRQARIHRLSLLTLRERLEEQHPA